MDNCVNQAPSTTYETITIADDEDEDAYVASSTTGGDDEFWMCAFCIILTHESAMLKLSKCSHMFCRWEKLENYVEKN